MLKSSKQFVKKTFIVMILLCSVASALFSVEILDRMAWYKANTPQVAKPVTWQLYSDYVGGLEITSRLLLPGDPYNFDTALKQEGAFSPGLSANAETILLIFNKTVYDHLAACSYLFDPAKNLLDKYKETLNERYGVIVCTYNSAYMDSQFFDDDDDAGKCPPNRLRERIKDYFTYDDDVKTDNPQPYGTLAGCIFIGELPVKWYRNGKPDVAEDGEENIWGNYVDFEFPIDLYFMDLDGTWIDANEDGLLDGTSGTVGPDIWVGRITAASLLNNLSMGAANEKLILEDYFNKNIYVREHDLNTQFKNQALILENLDTSNKNWIDTDLSTFYGAKNVFHILPADLNSTSKFTNNLISHSAINKINLVHIKVTGSALDHSFAAPNAAETTKSITSSELHAQYIQPPLFYMATAGSARYTENNFIGGAYIFTSNRNRVPELFTPAKLNEIKGKLTAVADKDYLTAAYSLPFGTDYALTDAVYNSAVEMTKVASLLIKAGEMKYSGGLALVGSTKSYCMENPTEFYHGLISSWNFGKSLQEALIKAIKPGQITTDVIKTTFGMTIIGDPTLGFMDETQIAIDKGIKWVIDEKLKNGKGGTVLKQSTANGALSAMTALVLLNRNSTSSVIEDALTYLTTPYDSVNWEAGCLKESGEEAWIVQPNGSDSVSVYSTSLAILALVAVHPDPDSASPLEQRRYEILRKMNNFLINCQSTSGALNGGFRYSKGYVNSSADNSNTQMALMAIYVASLELLPKTTEKKRENFPANVKTVFERARAWLDASSGGVNNGHHYYAGVPNYDKTMSAAGAWSWILAAETESAGQTKANNDFNYLATLANPFDFSGTLHDPGYYAWTLAKACVMSRSENPLPGKGDWYNELSKTLLSYRNQAGDGAGEWQDISALSGEHAISLSTLFALLSLEVKQLVTGQDVYKAFILKGSIGSKLARARGSLYKDVTYLSRDGEVDLPEVPADLRLYDMQSGRYTGINTEAGEISEEVPGSRFNLLDPEGNPVPYAGGPIPDGYSQEILIWMPNPGGYRLEMVGTKGTIANPAKYQLEVVSIKEDKVESSVKFEEQKIYTGEVQSSIDTVAIIDGGITNEPTPPKRSAIMILDPAEGSVILPYGQTSIHNSFRVKEIGGGAKIYSLRISHMTGFKDANGSDDIQPSMIAVTIPPNTNIDENSYYDITFTVTGITDAFDGPSTGIIRVEANDGLFKDYKYSIVRNRAPEANAGLDQTAYAGKNATPYAVVTLDGTASSDPDADELTYKWYANSILIAEGATPAVTLGTGVHTISLEVNDGSESASDDVQITVVDALAADVKITPKVINVKSWSNWVNSMMVLPSSVTRDNLDKSFKVMLYTPSGAAVTAYKQVYYGGHAIHYNFHGFRSDSRCHTNNSHNPVMIYSVFSRKDLLKIVPNGVVKLTAVYKLLSGQYVNASAVVVVIGANQKISSMDIYPGVIRRSADNNKMFKTSLKLPSKIDADDVNLSVKAVLYTPDGDIIEAAEQSLFPDYGSRHFGYSHHYYPKWVNAVFSQSALTEKLPENGYYELYQELKLNNGESIFGYCKIRITGKK